MQRVGAVLLAVYVLMVLQTTVMPMIPLLPVVPDLLLALTVWLGLRHPTIGGAIGALGIGYALDTYSGTALGLQMFAIVAAYLAAYVLARTVWTEGGVSSVLVTFAAACVRDLALAVAAVLTGEPGPYWRHFLQYGFVDAVVAAAIAPAVFAFVDWERERLFRVAA